MSETLADYITNEYVSGSLFLFVVLYLENTRVELPKFVVQLFENDIFRIIYLTLLLMISN
jgi:hypothetical protein